MKNLVPKIEAFRLGKLADCHNVEADIYKQKRKRPKQGESLKTGADANLKKSPLYAENRQHIADAR